MNFITLTFLIWCHKYKRGRYKSRTGSTRTASLGRINSDQLGSTKIVSDHEKNIKLNEIETITHLKVKIPVKIGPNKERLAPFLRVVLCSQAAILYSKCQFLSDSSHVPPSIPPSISTIMDPDEGKSFSMNLHLSTKLIVSVNHFCYTVWFRRNSLYFRLAPNLENRKLIDLANH